MIHHVRKNTPSTPNHGTGQSTGFHVEFHRALLSGMSRQTGHLPFRHGMWGRRGSLAIDQSFRIFLLGNSKIIQEILRHDMTGIV